MFTYPSDSHTVTSNSGFPFWILSHSFGVKSKGKPGMISLVIWWHNDVKSTGHEGNTSHVCVIVYY